MRILVLGAAGMLGRKVMEAFSGDHVAVGTARRAQGALLACDVTRLEDVRSVLRRAMPQAVVNCAAYTAVDLCEENRDLAFLANAVGARNVAIAAAEINADLCHVSSDYVFDGEKVGEYDEYDATAPLSVYGKSKLAGEEAVRAFAPRWSIVRTQWLYGEGGKNFPETIIRLAKEKPEIRVVDDQTGKPTYAGDTARQIRLIVEARQYGLFHAASGGVTTWYRFAKAVLERAGLGHVPMRPITTTDYPTPARRPKNSALRNMNLEMTIGDSMPPWEAGLDEFMRRRNDAPAAEGRA